MLALVLMLLACKADPNPQDGVDTDSELPPPIDGCDPEISPPPPFGQSDVEVVVDPHQNTFGGNPEPFHVRYGWPSPDPSQTASFLWRTDRGTKATVVEFGIGDDLSRRAEGASFVYGQLPDGSGGYRIHEVKLCSGLEPGTTYSYRVGGDGHWSPVYRFTTPGRPGSFDTFRVAIAGDSRGAYETWAELVGVMEAHDPDFYVFSGDMVEFGWLQEEWDAWFEAAGDVLARKALVPAHGNHEFLAAHYFAQFSLPHNEEWFHVRYGDLTLVTLNDTVREVHHVGGDQVAYMDAAFAENADAPWKMVLHHKALYSGSTVHGSNLTAREAWEPVIDAHGVQLVVAGHNHLYERSVPIRGGAAAEPGEGAIYLVSGGAGAPLYKNVDDEWFSEISNPVEHYVIADFGPTGVEVVARDLAGNVIDSFSIPRQ